MDEAIGTEAESANESGNDSGSRFWRWAGRVAVIAEVAGVIFTIALGL